MCYRLGWWAVESRGEGGGVAACKLTLPKPMAVWSCLCFLRHLQAVLLHAGVAQPLKRPSAYPSEGFAACKTRLTALRALTSIICYLVSVVS